MASSAEDRRQQRLRDLLALAQVPGELSERLDRAFVHPSAARERQILSNQRLEFLGDAVLGLATAHWLYANFPDESEGLLTKRKAAIVSGPAIARTAGRLAFSEVLLLGVGERAAGGEARPSILAGAFEAFLAALFLDHGFAAAERFIEREHIAHVDHDLAVQADPKSRLQELMQARSAGVPLYSETAEGPPHARIFSSVVTVDGKMLGKGTGPSKRSAQQDAAAAALATLHEAEVD